MKIIFLLINIIVLGCFVTLPAQQNDQLIFSHKYHIEEIEAVCSDCHGLVESSNSPADNLLPEMSTCYSCHDEDDSECSLCHTNSDNAEIEPRIVNLNSQFSHQQHISELECIGCHKNIPSKEAPGQSHIPDKSKCIDCHGEADYAVEKNKCLECHSNKDFNFMPKNHSVNWSKDHGIGEVSNSNSCIHCHQTDYCIECHQGDNLDRQIHSLNFVNNHGIQARLKNDNCLTCHQEQYFCIDCHNSEYVMPKNHSYANWSNTISGNGGRHAREAKYDMDYCTTCHSDVFSDNVCVVCHSK